MTPLRRELTGIALLVAILLGLSARQIRDEYLLLDHPQSAEAVVISKNLGHAWIGYSYVVAGHTYKGSTPAESTGRLSQDVSIGDSLIIRFSPAHPSISGTAETRDALTSTLPFLLSLVAVLAAVVLFRNVFRKYL